VQYEPLRPAVAFEPGPHRFLTAARTPTRTLRARRYRTFSHRWAFRPKIVGRAGQRAGIEFPVHPHMLRHATGYKLANDGQDTRSIQHYLGHRNIEHTTRYTELKPDRFRAFWSD